VETIELACATGRPRNWCCAAGATNDIVATAGGLRSVSSRGSGREEFGSVRATATDGSPRRLRRRKPLIEQPVARRESPRRVVKLIKNGVKSNVTLFMRAGR